MKGVVEISKKSRQFKNAEEEYDNSIKEFNEAKKRYKEAKKKLNTSKKEYVSKGISYYDTENRQNLLKKASATGYSENGIKKITDLADNWNPDYVDENTIREMRMIQLHVKDNQSLGENNPFSKLGGFFDDLFYGGNDE